VLTNYLLPQQKLVFKQGGDQVVVMVVEIQAGKTAVEFQGEALQRTTPIFF
jgi:hypothetical protein